MYDDGEVVGGGASVVVSGTRQLTSVWPTDVIDDQLTHSCWHLFYSQCSGLSLLHSHIIIVIRSSSRLLYTINSYETQLTMSYLLTTFRCPSIVNRYMYDIVTSHLCLVRIYRILNCTNWMKLINISAIYAVLPLRRRITHCNLSVPLFVPRLHRGRKRK